MKRRLFIPYFQTSRYRVDTMVHLARPKHNEKMADLGSGDGRILIAFAEKGIEAHGYELDNSLILQSKKIIQDKRLENYVFICKKDFWKEHLGEYDIVTIYPMPDIMDALEEKLLNELKPGARVLLNYYSFPNWKEITVKDSIYLYIK